MAAQPRIEALGDHEYLVRIPMDGDVVAVRVRATPTVITEIAGDDADEVTVVSATISYLTARQRPDDLPQELDLEDVVAAYDEFVDQVRGALSSRGE